MFKREDVSVRISNIVPELMEKDDEEIRLVRVSCEINPLTAELAEQLHDFVRGTLYTRSGVEVNSLLGGASFALAIPPQAVAFRAAPDQKKASFTIAEARVGHLKARRSKKSTAWTFAFTLTCSPASDHQLAQIMACYCRTQYLTFAPAAPGLFDEAPVPSSRGLTEVETGEVDEDLIDDDEADDVTDGVTPH